MNERRNRHKTTAIKILQYAPIFGYVGAQIIVLGAWAWRIQTLGIAENHEQGEVLGAFAIAAALCVPPALVLGTLDGIARLLQNAGVRIVIAILLLLFAWLWIAMWMPQFTGTHVSVMK